MSQISHLYHSPLFYRIFIHLFADPQNIIRNLSCGAKILTFNTQSWNMLYWKIEVGLALCKKIALHDESMVVNLNVGSLSAAVLSLI